MDCPYGILLIALLQGVTCQQWSVGLPRRIRALQGSCVVIPCTFTYPEINKTDEQFSITWCLYSSTAYPEVFNSKIENNVEENFKGRTELVGRPSHGNCSLRINNVRVDDARKYYPLIDRETSNFRFWDTTTSVEVSDTPEKLTIPSPGKMTEGIPVTITCSAEHTCPSSPPTLAWDQFQNNISVHHEDLGSGRWRTVLVLNYYPAVEDHTKFLTCKATYPNEKTNSESISFFILHSPKGVRAVISSPPKDRMEAGDTLSLSLRCEANTSNPAVINYTWYKDGFEIPNQSQESLRLESVVAVDSGVYSCVAHNVIGSSISSPPVMVHVTAGSSPRWADPIIGISTVVVAAIVIAVAVSTWRYLKNKKPSNAANSTELSRSSDHAGEKSIFENVDNVYAALDPSQISPEYEEIRIQDRQAGRCADR